MENFFREQRKLLASLMISRSAFRKRFLSGSSGFSIDPFMVETVHRLYPMLDMSTQP